MKHSNAATVLGEFGHKIGLEHIAFNDERLCTLSFDDIITHLELSEDASFLCCHLWIADIPAGQRTEVALAIGDANYLLARTHGATLGMNRQNGDLVLTARFPDATLTLERFEQALEHLLNDTLLWQTKIATRLSTESTDTDTATAPQSGADPLSSRA